MTYPDLSDVIYDGLYAQHSLEYILVFDTPYTRYYNWMGILLEGKECDFSWQLNDRYALSQLGLSWDCSANAPVATICSGLIELHCEEDETLWRRWVRDEVLIYLVAAATLDGRTWLRVSCQAPCAREFSFYLLDQTIRLFVADERQEEELSRLEAWKARVIATGADEASGEDVAYERSTATQLPARVGVAPATGAQKRGPTLKTQERAEVFKRPKDAHPTWSQSRVAMEASKELEELVTADSVRNAYRRMDWKWERADRIR